MPALTPSTPSALPSSEGINERSSETKIFLSECSVGDQCSASSVEYLLQRYELHDTTKEETDLKAHSVMKDKQRDGSFPLRKRHDSCCLSGGELIDCLFGFRLCPQEPDNTAEFT